MKDYHINIFYSEEDEGYAADIPDLKYCSAFGESPEEALPEVLRAKDVWSESALHMENLPLSHIIVPWSTKQLNDTPQNNAIHSDRQGPRHGFPAHW